MPYMKSNLQGIPFIFTAPGTAAVGSWGTAAKVIAAGGLAATATYALLGSKTAQQQTQSAAQTGSAIAEPKWQVDVKPGGTATFYGAGGTPQVTQGIDQAQEQKATTPDYMGMILIGALAIGGLIILNKFGGKK